MSKPAIDFQQIYQTFWARFIEAWEKAGASVSPRSSPFLQKYTDKTTVCIELKEPIHLMKCVWRPDSPKNIDILITGYESLKLKSQPLVTASGIKVNYFEVAKRQASLIECIHYDYIETPQDKHPVFHAQLSDECIDQAEIEKSETFSKYTLTSKQQGRIRTIKLPTAHMGFASVLCGILADHTNITQTDFSVRLKIVNEMAGLPKPCIETLTGKIQADNHSFRGLCWYQ